MKLEVRIVNLNSASLFLSIAMVGNYLQLSYCIGFQVFHVSEYKGWGIRTLEVVPRGTFVFEYAGEVVTNAELLKRGDRSKYTVHLDADWESEAQKDDNSLLCIDATIITNVGRWLNHRYICHFKYNLCQRFCICSNSDVGGTILNLQ